MESFDIYFLGEMLPDADPTTVRQGVAKLFKVQESAVDRLFAGKPLRVKQGVDAEAAGRYRTAFRDVGALVQIVASGSPPPAPKAPDERAAHTPGAEAEAPHRPPADSGGYGLAEPGAILDHSEAPAPAEIDTGSLEALPPNTGSLEDCRVEKPHRPIPDISHLRLVDD
ncbi:MAG: hypothetical protein KJN79_11380 [Gammaproteobacteria bacterium]|jgi:hypothetical protein|nr:hypothetical protein [Gammaproteobacteria bacterium]